jgi:adenylate cyclase
LADAQDDPATLRRAGQAVAWFAQDRAGGWAALERALMLNPSSAQVLGSAAWILNYLGEAKRAIPLFQRAIQISRIDPEMAFFLSGQGFALPMLSRH